MICLKAGGGVDSLMWAFRKEMSLCMMINGGPLSKEGLRIKNGAIDWWSRSYFYACNLLTPNHSLIVGRCVSV